jgi:hypothetical protein
MIIVFIVSVRAVYGAGVAASLMKINKRTDIKKIEQSG